MIPIKAGKNIHSYEFDMFGILSEYIWIFKYQEAVFSRLRAFWNDIPVI